MNSSIDALETDIVKKVAWRILPLIIIAYSIERARGADGAST
jgi:hypothetical protein